MSALIDAVAAKDLLDVIGQLAAVADDSRRPPRQAARTPCALVCGMWASVILSESADVTDAPSIAMCMLRDCRALAAIA